MKMFARVVLLMVVGYFITVTFYPLLMLLGWALLFAFAGFVVLVVVPTLWDGLRYDSYRRM